MIFAGHSTCLPSTKMYMYLKLEISVVCLVSEPGPAIKIDGSETLRHPVDILLLELMKAYIFYHSGNITKKFIHESTIYFEL